MLKFTMGKNKESKKLKCTVNYDSILGWFNIQNKTTNCKGPLCKVTHKF